VSIYFLTYFFPVILQGVLKLKHKAMADDTRPIDPTCPCMVCFRRSTFYLKNLFAETSTCFSLFLLSQVCKNYTRAYIHCLVTKDAMGSQLLSYHNLYYMLQVQGISSHKWTIITINYIVLMCMIKVIASPKFAAQ